MAYSQNGWPALASSSRMLVNWVIPGTGGKTLKLRHGSAGFLLVHFSLWFDQKLEDLNGKVMDDWAYAYRPVRGYATLSNHASGTAIDLNATQHPIGSSDTFSDREEREIIERVDDFFDGCIRWGGQYQGRKDEMHFELARPLAAVERKARRLMDTPRGEAVLKANPGQRRIILS